MNNCYSSLGSINSKPKNKKCDSNRCDGWRPLSDNPHTRPIGFGEYNAPRLEGQGLYPDSTTGEGALREAGSLQRPGVYINQSFNGKDRFNDGATSAFIRNMLLFRFGTAGQKPTATGRPTLFNTLNGPVISGEGGPDYWSNLQNGAELPGDLDYMMANFYSHRNEDSITGKATATAWSPTPTFSKEITSTESFVDLSYVALWSTPTLYFGLGGLSIDSPLLPGTSARLGVFGTQKLILARPGVHEESRVTIKEFNQYGPDALYIKENSYEQRATFATGETKIAGTGMEVTVFIEGASEKHQIAFMNACASARYKVLYSSMKNYTQSFGAEFGVDLYTKNGKDPMASITASARRSFMVTRKYQDGTQQSRGGTEVFFEVVVTERFLNWLYK